MQVVKCRDCKHAFSVPSNSNVGCAKATIIIKQQYSQNDNDKPLDTLVKRLAQEFGFEDLNDNCIKKFWCYFPFVYDPSLLKGQCRYYDKDASNAANKRDQA